MDVSADLQNTGGADGSATVSLIVNGANVDSRTIAVAAGATEHLGFTFTPNHAGTFNVTVKLSTGQTLASQQITVSTPSAESRGSEDLFTAYRILASRPAMPARATRAAVSPVIDRRDREPASREMRDEVPVATEMLRIAVRDQDDATRFRSGPGALIEDGHAAHAQTACSSGPSNASRDAGNASPSR